MDTELLEAEVKVWSESAGNQVTDLETPPVYYSLGTRSQVNKSFRHLLLLLNNSAT